MNLINIKSSILVLLFISVSVLTFSVYYIHKEVRNMKMVMTKHTHDLNNVFGVVGGVASGQVNNLPVVRETDEYEENNESDEEEDLVQVDHEDTVEVFENPPPDNNESSENTTQENNEPVEDENIPTEDVDNVSDTSDSEDSETT